MTTEEAFLADIIAKPEDDLPRLVYADWLDENGRPERAEFIRVQVAKADRSLPVGSGRWLTLDLRERRLWHSHPGHTFTGGDAQPGPQFRYRIDGSELEYAPTGASDDTPKVVFRRGFVHTVRCTLADWCGSACQTCAARNRVLYFVDPGPCPSCGTMSHGTGRTPGIGPEVVRRHPVERVVLTDREPLEFEGAGKTLYSFTFGRTDVGGSHVVNDCLHAHLPPPSSYDITSSESVKLALSAALIVWAKSQPISART